MTVELTALAQYIASGLVVGAIYGLIGVGFLRRARHDCTTQSGIGRQHAVKANQVQAWAWRQRGQALHELQRRHPDVRGAIAPGALQLQHDATRAILLEPFVGERGARDVAAQAFEFFALMLPSTHPGMQAEAVRIGA